MRRCRVLSTVPDGGVSAPMATCFTNPPPNAIILRAGPLETSPGGAFPTPCEALKHPSISSPHFCLALLMRGIQAGPWGSMETTRDPRGSSHLLQPCQLGEAALASLRPSRPCSWLPHLELKPHWPGLYQSFRAEGRGGCCGLRVGVPVPDCLPLLGITSAQQREMDLTSGVVALALWLGVFCGCQPLPGSCPHTAQQVSESDDSFPRNYSFPSW